MQTPTVKKGIRDSAWFNNTLAVTLITVMLIYGEIPAMLIVAGGVWTVQKFTSLQDLPLFIAEYATGTIALALAGIPLAILGAWLVKPRATDTTNDKKKDTKSSISSQWRSKRMDAWLQRGQALGFVLASYAGGAMLVSGWYARKGDPHPIRKGIAGGLVLAIPSCFTWEVVVYRPSDAWMVPIPWIGLVVLIPLIAAIYRSRWVRIDWWLFRFIPNLLSGRRHHRQLRREIQQIRLERLILTRPTDNTKCIDCTNVTQREQCPNCAMDSECPRHHIQQFTDYATYIVHPGNPKQGALYRAARQCEENIHWDQEHAGPLALWRKTRRYRTTTALTVMVDQRLGKDGKHHDRVIGMARVIWGSSQGLPTLNALRQKPWDSTDQTMLMRATNFPEEAITDIDQVTGGSMSVATIGIEKVYRPGGSHYDETTNVLQGLIAQVCQIGESAGVRWCFATVPRAIELLIRRYTKVPFKSFPGLGGYVECGSTKRMRPVWCNFQEWTQWMPQEHPEEFQCIFRDGLSNRITLEMRKDPLRISMRS